MHVRKTFMPRWWNGRHWRLKISWPETAVRVRVPLAVHGFRIANNLYYFFDTHKVYNTIRLMFKKIFLPFAAVALLALTSCSGKLGALSADNFNVNPNPMETQGGSVPVTINGNFPEKYMKKKAVVTVTPELRAADGSILRGTPATFQGEKVMGNNQTISYKLGGHYTMKADFPYTDTYHKSDLYLSFNAMVGKKVVEVPAVKVANGIIATSELYRMAMTQNGGCIALDTFQRVRQARQAANIKFLINQAQLRKGELNNTTVQDFLETLRTINNEKEAYILSNIEVKAYTFSETTELQSLCNSIVAECKALYIPSDNTVSANESIVGTICSENKLPVYTSYGGVICYASLAIDYYQLGWETGKMAAEILLNGKNPADIQIKTLTPTVMYNEALCEQLGIPVPEAE